MDRTAQIGDNVCIHFSAYHEDGTKIATTLGEKPIELTIGDRKLIECVENNIVGMFEGEKKTMSIPPHQAMGERQPELVATLPLAAVPEQHEDLEVGSKVEVKDENGKKITGSITYLTDQEVTVDANHPLAGKKLVIDIELIGFL